MMQQSHLTAWQVHAPWEKRSKIEQDLRLARSIAAIFPDDVLATHVAMRGGTVLHKGHLAPAARYSEDIDLVLVRPMDKDALDARLRKALTPVCAVDGAQTGRLWETKISAFGYPRLSEGSPNPFSDRDIEGR